MGYTILDIDKIISFKTWTDKQKVDELLRMDCNIYCNLGIDSTKKEKEEATKNSRKLYTAIKKVNPQLGGDFLRLMDKR